MKSDRLSHPTRSSATFDPAVYAATSTGRWTSPSPRSSEKMATNREVLHRRHCTRRDVIAGNGATGSRHHSLRWLRPVVRPAPPRAGQPTWLDRCAVSPSALSSLSSRPLWGREVAGCETDPLWSKSPHFAHLWVHRFQKVCFIREFMRDYSNYTIFEGTSEIQRLIIARVISGVHIR